MLDFRPKGVRTRNYLSRREQRRLLLLVMSAGLVMLLVHESSKPKHWAWIRGGAAPAPPAANPRPAPRAAVKRPLAADPAEAALAEVDAEPARPPARPALGPDEFIIEGETKHELPEGKRYFPGVRADLLARVRDDTVFRSAESGSFYNLLTVLNGANEDELERASSGDVSFLQLYNQPKEFRGELVNIRGTVRRIQTKRLAANESGLDEYHQVVLEPEDRAYPVVIYCLELPDGFPEGERLDEPATLTGFFFKRWAHMSGDGIRTWPLLLAKTVRWQPRAPQAAIAQAPVNAQTLLAAMFVATLITLLVVAFVMSRTRYRRLSGRPNGAPRLSGLKHEPVAADVREQLAQLSKQDV